MKKIAVIPNPKKDLGLNVTKKVVETLIKANGEVYISSDFLSLGIPEINYYSDFPVDSELIVVVGGDGSMLDASVKAIELNIPIVGVNLGKVGYLSEIEPDNIDVLRNVVEDNFEIEEKMLLSTQLHSKNKIIRASRLAVNDVVVSHDSYLGIAEFTVCTLGDSTKYRADGLVVSTPAGSTAYSLSAGGPIVSHRIEAMVVTPVCPHSFFDRSIVFSPSDVIKIKNTGEERLNISIDGRYFEALCPEDECIVEVSDKKVKVLAFKENNMFSSLFKKMRIMEDIK